MSISNTCTALAAKALSTDVVVPLLLFGVISGSIWFLLRLAQKKDDFNIERVFTDESGKPSSARLLSLMSFAFSVWYMASRSLSGHSDPSEFLYFLMAWSGTATVLELVRKWDGVLPGARPKDSKDANNP